MQSADKDQSKYGRSLRNIVNVLDTYPDKVITLLSSPKLPRH